MSWFTFIHTIKCYHIWIEKWICRYRGREKNNELNGFSLVHRLLWVIALRLNARLIDRLHGTEIIHSFTSESRCQLSTDNDRDHDVLMCSGVGFVAAWATQSEICSRNFAIDTFWSSTVGPRITSYFQIPRITNDWNDWLANLHFIHLHPASNWQ